MARLSALIGSCALLATAASADTATPAELAAVPVPCTPTASLEPRSGAGSADRTLLDAGTRTLAAVLTESRDAALRDGVQSIPAQIRAELEGFVPEAFLDAVRWRVGGNSQLTLQGWLSGFEVVALTLDRVVVFANVDTALGDAGLWAHELRHVMQYERCGIDGFARGYLTDRDALEADARAYANAWHRWTLDRWLERVSTGNRRE